MVRGNNDFFKSAWRRRIHGRGISYIYNARTRVYMYLWEKRGWKQEAKRARSGYCDVWPTHRPFYEKEEGLITLNPGSLVYPRQPGEKA